MGEKNRKNHHQLLKPLLGLWDCPNCKRATLPYHVCKCGWYKDKPFTYGAIKVKEIKDRKTAKQVQAE